GNCRLSVSLPGRRTVANGATMKRWLLVLCVISLAGSARALSQEPPPAKENPIHDELRALKRGAEEAFNKGDIDGLLANYVDKNVIATWQNAEVNNGHKAIKDFYQRMMVGPNHIVDSLQTKIDVDELAHLYGSDTATALGDMTQHYKLTDGKEFDLKS